jgi:hypothetical protein
MPGKCPYCGSAVLAVVLNEVSVLALATNWRGVTYSCQACSAVLSVGIDPIAVKADLVDEIAARLRER